MEKTSLRIRILKFFNRHDNTRALSVLSPCIFWVGIFFILPLVLMALYSFLQRGLYGGVSWIFTWENYARFVDPLYLKILLRTFVFLF